jgi:hypothetical protein
LKYKWQAVFLIKPTSLCLHTIKKF